MVHERFRLVMAPGRQDMLLHKVGRARHLRPCQSEIFINIKLDNLGQHRHRQDAHEGAERLRQSAEPFILYEAALQQNGR